MKSKHSKTYWQARCKTEDVPSRKLWMKTSPFLATSAMMLATLAVQEDCGVNRFANNSSIPLPCIFSLVSVSERERGGGLP